MKIAKPEPVSGIDSETSKDYVEPTEPVKHKRKSKKPPKPKKAKRSGTLITRSYFLRKDSKGTSANVKPRGKHKFKCRKCKIFCPSVKALNAHFKLRHRKLQCKDCGKFFLTLDRTDFILTLIRTASLNASLANAHLHSKVSWISICTVTPLLDNISARKLDVTKALVTSMT